MTRPLQHLRVLDFTRVRAGPTCARIFADFGADVIKVESPPGVDPNESMSGSRDGYDMVNLHRNKRSLTLNLKTDKGQEILRRLVPTADVVIENFRPDVKDRLGLGYETLSALNPGIILASISGFGQTGPYRLRRGFDQIAQGMGGLMSVTGEPGRGPMRAGIAVADSSAGLFAAIGILIAIEERRRSGMGQWVQSSLLEAQISMMDFQAASYLIDGVAPGQAGNDHPYSVPTGVFPTKDGYLNLGVAGEGQWKGLCLAITRKDLLSEPKFKNGDARLANRKHLNRELEATFKTRTTREWLEILDQAGIPAGPIYSVDEVFSDPQVEHLGMAVPVKHHRRGDISVVATPIRLSRTPWHVSSALPDPGSHNDEILKEIGLSDPEIEELRAGSVV